MLSERGSGIDVRRPLQGAALLGLLGALACSGVERDFGSGGGGSGGSGGTGGAPGSGPQLVRSTPADGADQASIEPYFFLYFDRPMSAAAATDKIRVTSDNQASPAFVQTLPCPDNDVTCVAGVYPEAFVDGGGRLLGGIQHTIVIDKSLADSDGNQNDVDAVLSYTTFRYDLSLVDDSSFLKEEVGGLDYDPGSQALFACGLNSFNDSYFLIRKVQLADGSPVSINTAASPSTAGTGGPLCYGLDIFEGKLHAAATYADRVFVYSDLQGASLGQPAVLGQTPFPPPNDRLAQVQSTAVLDGMAIFGAGNYHGGDKLTRLLAFDLASGGYDIWLDPGNEFSIAEGLTLAPGRDLTGDRHLYLADHQGRKVLKIDALNRQVVNQHPIDDLHSGQLRTDSKGRLYVGTHTGLRVFDTSGSAGFQEIASRAGLAAGRFGLREEGTTVHIYFVDFRSKGVIGTTEIRFVN